MTKITLGLLVSFLSISAFAHLTDQKINSTQAVVSDKTPTGIPLDTEWKKQIYAYAQKNVAHPSWGLAHSERNYQVTKELAKKEGFILDEDVLFASAYLHDLGGLAPFAKDGVDHAARSVEIIETLLTQWGYPMSKWPQVKEMILGHIYYGPAPASLPAQAFRDADIVDFLGSIGVARILAITLEPGNASPTLKPMIDTLKSFASSMPGKCSLKSCIDIATPRKSEMQRFLSEIEAESFHGSAL